MPAVYLNYVIPPNAKAESLIVTQFQFIQIPGEYYIYPAQPPTVIGETVPWVPPDTLVYNSDNIFPGKFIKIVSEGIMDGARIVTVEVCPLQYRPKTKRLFLVRSIGFEFVYGPNNPPGLRAQIRGRYEQVVYDAVLRSVVENDNEILAYYQKPAIVEEEQLGSLAPYPVGPSIIIAPQEFWSAFQPYADWLTDQGIKTYLITPQTIYNYFSGVDNAEKVRNYIKYCYENAGGTYFILGGDDYSNVGTTFVPIRYCWSNGVSVYYWDTIVPCDLYFSDLTGNWNSNGNNRWGEMSDDADRFPEVYVGRITASNVQEVTNLMTKALHYEKTPGVTFNNALWIYNEPEVGIGDAWETFPLYFAHTHLPDRYADVVLYHLNQGYAFANINCHGNVTKFCCWMDTTGWWGWIHSWQSSQPNHNHAGLNWSDNLNKYYPVYSISCWTGAYDSLIYTPLSPSDTCIADAFVDAYLHNQQGNQGPFNACAFLGNTRNGLMSYSHDLQYEFYWRIFNPWWIGAPPEPSWTRIGVAEALSKCGNRINWGDYCARYVCYTHNLFGSPYFESWTDTPGNLQVTHPTRIYVGQQIQFTVTVKDAMTNRLLRYAKVCLNKPGDIYQVGSTNANGQVTFTIKPQTTGTLKVTVTRLHNADNNYTQYRPSQTTCQVEEPEGGGQALGSDDLIPTTLCIVEMATILKNNTVLKFGLPKEDNISLVLYDATGSKVRSLLEGEFPAGYHKISLPTEQLPTGIYFVVLRENDEQVSKKFLLIK
uniref:T9SS type A sorting domain-containing protein n=1 Tax=candidate division WOR-3 bacterium TaxID=2052148 RepID=A0A7V1EIL2_UNCW3